MSKLRIAVQASRPFTRTRLQAQSGRKLTIKCCLLALPAILDLLFSALHFVQTRSQYIEDQQNTNYITRINRTCHLTKESGLWPNPFSDFFFCVSNRNLDEYIYLEILCTVTEDLWKLMGFVHGHSDSCHRPMSSIILNFKNGQTTSFRRSS